MKSSPPKLVRISLLIPEDLLLELRGNTKNLTRYFIDAAKARRQHERREAALQKLMELPPTFTDIENPSEYVHTLRREEESERSKRFDV